MGEPGLGEGGARPRCGTWRRSSAGWPPSPWSSGSLGLLDVVDAVAVGADRGQPLAVPVLLAPSGRWPTCRGSRSGSSSPRSVESRYFFMSSTSPWQRPHSSGVRRARSVPSRGSVGRGPGGSRCRPARRRSGRRPGRGRSARRCRPPSGGTWRSGWRCGCAAGRGLGDVVGAVAVHAHGRPSRCPSTGWRSARRRAPSCSWRSGSRGRPRSRPWWRRAGSCTAACRWRGRSTCPSGSRCSAGVAPWTDLAKASWSMPERQLLAARQGRRSRSGRCGSRGSRPARPGWQRGRAQPPGRERCQQELSHR